MVHRVFQVVQTMNFHTPIDHSAQEIIRMFIKQCECEHHVLINVEWSVPTKDQHLN